MTRPARTQEASGCSCSSESTPRTPARGITAAVIAGNPFRQIARDSDHASTIWRAGVHHAAAIEQYGTSLSPLMETCRGSLPSPNQSAALSDSGVQMSPRQACPPRQA